MAGEKPDVLLVGARKPVLIGGLEPKVTLHDYLAAKDKDAFLASVADKMRVIVVAYTNERISPEYWLFPKLEQTSCFDSGCNQVNAELKLYIPSVTSYCAGSIRQAVS
ncbi:MAG TPA: hypothetical protein VGF02_03970 [Pseudolabrys sp.]